jgi:hypothetical protein
MNCTEFEEIVHDLDRPGTHGLEMRERALLHAESCGRCAMLAIENEALDFGLHKMSLQDVERKASPSAEAALLREFRRQKVLAAPRVVRWQIAAIGVAAMLLLALGVTLRREARLNAGGGSPVTPSTATTATNVQNAGVDVPSTIGPVTNSAAPTQTNAQQAASDADDSEYATAFVPLPYADDLTALDNGAVVRVMLSRSALTSLGLPEAEMGGADRVSADLVVSDDGTPQAIRLVSQENYN